jgi:hypothetical protein
MEAALPSGAYRAAALRRCALVVPVLAALALAGVSCRHLPTAGRTTPGTPVPAPGVAPLETASPGADVAPLHARRHWWNYYRRSLDYALAGDWQRAAWDLEICLGRRRGALFAADREQRRTKTYGLHYLDDYFPHRELGVCLFHLGQFTPAEAELLRSLEMLPTSRARFYLNAVRQARLQTTTEAAPESDVVIELDPPAGPIVTNQLYVDLRGTVSSTAFIARVAVHGKPLFIELAASRYALAERVVVVPGEQEVTVEAEDLLGRRGQARCRVVVDLEGPDIAVSRAPEVDSKDAIVTVTDNRELARVEIDGRPLTLTPGQSSVSNRVGQGQRTGVAVVATDRAGNRTALAGAKAERGRAASGPGATDWLRPGRPRLGLRAGTSRPLLLAQAPAAAGNTPATGPAAGAGPADTLPPLLSLFPPAQGRIVVTTSVYVLDLQIEDGGGVAAVTYDLDGRQETREFQPADASVRRLTRSLLLTPGEHLLSVVVRDRAGNSESLKLRIKRQADTAWREDLRVTSQVMPPAPGPSQTAPPVDLYPLLIDALVRSPARLNLVERDPAVMQRLLQELQLSQSDLAAKTAAIRTGRLRTSDWCLVSRAVVWPGPENFDLLLEIVDVATSEVLLSSDIHFTSTAREHLLSQLQGLVAKMEQQLPRLTATVSKRAGRTVVLPLGTDQQVLRGMYVLFMPADADSSTDHEPLAWRDGSWVQGRVDRVVRDSCRVTLFPSAAVSAVAAGDLAILR